YIANHVPISGATNADTQDHLYRNNGNETFTDVSALLSDAGDITGATFIGGWMDFDLDGDADLFVINDCLSPGNIPNMVFRNDGDTHPTLDWNFTEVSGLLGVDSCANGMGLAMGDYNRDGIPDYFFSNIGPTILFEGTGAGFTNVTSTAGTGGQPWPLFSWGTCFFDADLDGWEDLFLTLGSHHFDSATDPQQDMFFLNDGNGVSFTNRSAQFNLSDPARGRTVVAGDYDRDGDRDLAIVNYGESILIKENNLVHQHHYLDVRLVGNKSNRNGIGARLRIRTADGMEQWRLMYSGSSLGGGDELSAHFGLGNNDRVDTLEIFWPGSLSPQRVTSVLADQRITVREFDPSTAGIAFDEVAVALGIDGQCGTCGVGNGVSFADFNGDGLDDITYGTQPGDSVLFYQNNGSGFTKLPSLVNCTDKTETILWFDYDNDGDQDLLLANFQAQNRLYRNDGNLNLTEITSSCGMLMQNDPTYSACAIDYDHDGDLDFYLGNWFSTTYGNYLYRNDGSDLFTEVSMAAGVDDSLNLTLASGFFDYDNDGWTDLYNSQDRYFSFNSLFHNNGDGTFTDVSATSNTDIGIDAMNVGVGDYNNDDYLDIYVTNTVNAPQNTHPYNVLLKNQGNGTFAEVAADVGVEMYDVTWGGNFVDVDLDRDVDLYVSAMHQSSTSSSDLFINQFPVDTFLSIEPAGMEGDTMNSFSNAIGDLDNNGLPDIAVNNNNYFGQVNKFQVWRNASNVEGHWLKMRLHGITSNRNAVGSRIEFFIDGQKYIRYTQCGTAYLAQNSMTELIGTGTSHTIDT
ncbi:MAG: VCBS repeat-containing protein, partial [Saprospiraceae bacterium]|nr:VCBS repeat-containing protein [Saprospiraceae bacterium]